MSKRPGSARANKAEECQAKYDREAFSEHLENKKECIYHRLTQGVEETEQELANKYGTRVTLYLKDNNMSYKEMHRVICRYARTILNRLSLMVDCKSNFQFRVHNMGYFLHG